MEVDNEPSTPNTSSQGKGGAGEEEEEEEEGEAGEERALEYERERLLRIKENRARLEALGLLRPCSKPPQGASKGKKAAVKRGDDDDEYRPSDEDRNDEEDDYEPLPTGSRQNLKAKGRKKISFKSIAKTRKRPNREGSMKEDELVDNDEASLQQAIALSLGSVTECSTGEAGGPSQNSGKTTRDAQLHGMTDKTKSQATSAKKKQRKLNSSRVQLTEDELVAFFFSFDEAGKGHISLRDLQRMAIAHDFSWTEMEIALMIHCFDSDKDGKLSLEDFRKIVSRCNMLREPGNS
ncbi:EF-hand-containing protein [Dioscorea alata]|uniref:EF-hand-containing protein n=1 Tax=Dioscorea alata TaxID=55571 RepID=A0ACB7WIX4_DIOAL|nr:EF-hand-containing protein [Dioscorea alata]